MNKEQLDNIKQRFEKKVNEVKSDWDFNHDKETVTHYFGYRTIDDNGEFHTVVDFGHIWNFIKEEMEMAVGEAHIIGFSEGLEVGKSLLPMLGTGKEINNEATKLTTVCPKCGNLRTKFTGEELKCLKCSYFPLQVVGNLQ